MRDIRKKLEIKEKIERIKISKVDRLVGEDSIFQKLILIREEKRSKGENYDSINQKINEEIEKIEEEIGRTRPLLVERARLQRLIKRREEQKREGKNYDRTNQRIQEEIERIARLL